MVKIIEEINEVISKIKENIDEKSLSEDGVQQLLVNIDNGLAKVKKSAEGKQEVDKKVKELRGKIDDAISDELRRDLEELEKELEKPQKKHVSSQQSTEIDSNKVVELEKEIKEKDEKIQKLQQEIGARDAFLELLDKKIAGMSDGNEKLNINKVVEQAKINWLEGFKVAVESTDAGAGILTRPAAGLLAGGAAGIASAVHIGVYGLEKSADNAMEVYENTREGAQHFSELIANNTKDVVTEGISGAKEVAENFLGIFNRKQRTASLEEKIKMLEQQLEKKDEEFKQRLEYRDKQIENKNEEIGDLRKRKDNEIKELKQEIKELREQLNSLQDKLIAQVQVEQPKPVSPKSPYGGKN